MYIGFCLFIFVFRISRVLIGFCSDWVVIIGLFSDLIIKFCFGVAFCLGMC